ncbi:cyclic nucleotide-binding domain-containing protein [Candidatus Bipolaricaulota bacterium]|nr:cyclic nucleotide-binding domain-containing protein [Candidatus Bipolaricaulota bacterium]
MEPKALQRFAPCIQQVRFERGTTIVHEGTPSIGWVILCRGSVKLTVSAEDGKRLRFCGPGELLAGSFSGAHCFSVIAASPAWRGLSPASTSWTLAGGTRSCSPRPTCTGRRGSML